MIRLLNKDDPELIPFNIVPLKLGKCIELSQLLLAPMRDSPEANSPRVFFTEVEYFGLTTPPPNIPARRELEPTSSAVHLVTPFELLSAGPLKDISTEEAGFLPDLLLLDPPGLFPAEVLHSSAPSLVKNAPYAVTLVSIERSGAPHLASFPSTFVLHHLQTSLSSSFDENIRIIFMQNLLHR
ncbi:hypothetical protein Tco_0221509 [Tanacetum coccineum]